MTTTKAPGVLLLIADDWSPIAGCYGDDVIRMPHVDVLAREATRFDQAFCTTPSCAASRATILTGLQSHAHGQYGHCHGRHTFRILPDLPTLPGVLQKAGIRSGVIGKQHVHPPEQFPWDYQTPLDSLQEMQSSARTFFDEIGDAPFYLHVGFTHPHRIGDGFNNDEITYDPATIPVPDFLPDCKEVRHDLADYYTAVSRLDEGMGMMLEELRASGRWENTLVLVMSDHGMPFPGAKASSFDSGHQCPLLIRSPQDPKPQNSDALVNWTDIMPTILDWFDVREKPPTHGKSVLPLLQNPQQSGWESTFLSHSFHEVTNYYPYRILRTRQWKYVLNLFPELTLPLPSDLFASKTWQTVEAHQMTHMGKRRVGDVLHQDAEKLYDIQDDPAETTNLAHFPEHAETLQEMRTQVQQWREETGDLWLNSDRQNHLKSWRRQ